MKNLINIRVLQHDTNDQIRIGMAYPIIDLDKAEKDIVDNYEKKTAWCGGFKLLVRNITNVLLLFVRTRWK